MGLYGIKPTFLNLFVFAGLGFIPIKIDKGIKNVGKKISFKL